MGGLRWFPDELAGAGPGHLDPGYVAEYERKAGFDPTPEIELLRGYGLGPESTLVDMGAGTGRFAFAAAEICRTVVAVDVSTAMLESVRVGAQSRGLLNLEVVRQGFLTYEHRGERADFVYTRNALHHLPDFWKAVALLRLAALLKPGGILRLRDLVFSFLPAETESAITAWLDDAPEHPQDGWTRAELETHLREEHSTFTWLLEPTLHRAGFEIREATFSQSRVFAAYVCLKT
jgi:SAM-dependent methyltransferase